MTTYSIHDSDLGKIEYRDKKRYLWALSVFLPLFPLLGVLLYFYTASEWTLGIPLLFSYLCIPVLDSLFGSDTNNPPEAVVPLLEQDRYYRLLTYITVPLHFVNGNCYHDYLLSQESMILLS